MPNVIRRGQIYRAHCTGRVYDAHVHLATHGRDKSGPYGVRRKRGPYGIKCIFDLERATLYARV
jgi:hypothetical protein